MVHPAPTLLYTAKIEHEEDFQYYMDFTPSQGALVEALDAERMALGKAYGLELRTMVDEYKHTYDTFGDTMYEVVTNAVLPLQVLWGRKRCVHVICWRIFLILWLRCRQWDR